MKRWIDFNMNAAFTMRGFEGGALPIDKMAELVLSSDVNPIRSITCDFGGRPTTYEVVASSETHVGATGATSLIAGA